jgi:hypothetical protein
MAFIIQDGTGSGRRVSVDTNNRLDAHSIQRSEERDQVFLGEGFNFNSGEVSISATTAMLYIKNNDARVVSGQALTLNINAMAIGIGSGTFSGEASITVIRNPTTGTIIDNGTAADMKSNQNFGSNKTGGDLDVYKGASGYTFTDGSNHALFYMNSGAAPSSSRLFATFPWVLPQGASIGVKVAPNLTSGSCNCYVALIGHFVPDDTSS